MGTIQITDKDLKNMISESINKILKENMDAAQVDLDNLRRIYNMTLQLENFANDCSFGNSPIVEHTEAIMQYCIAQKKRIKGITESVNEDFTNTQIRNTLGIYDDDELNAAVECESKEEILGKIFNYLSELAHGQNPYNYTYRFNEIVDAFAKFGFDYVGPDEEEESHVFMNGDTEIMVTPTMFYTKQGEMRIRNANIF